MKRALTSCWTLLLAVVLVGLAGSAAYAGKPSVAVLGLEVNDTSGQLDQASIAVARDVTEALRARAKLGTSPYTLQPGSDKELIDEKLMKNCDSEAPGCMSQIGRDLGADFLIYGQVKKVSDGYQITLSLLNVGKKRQEKSKAPLIIPFDKKDTASLQAAARKAYNDLTGVSDGGTLVVKANADDGTVFIDGAAKGSLSYGQATLNLPEGRYRVAVEGQGFSKRSDEVVVTIRGGETTTQDITVGEGGAKTREYMGTTSSSSGGRGGYKALFAVSLVIGAGSGGFWIWSYAKEKSASHNVDEELAGSGLMPNDDHDCDNAEIKARSKSYADACRYKGYTTWGIIGTGVGGVAALVTGYLAFRGHDESPPVGASRVGQRTRKQRDVLVTPVMSASGGGVTLRFDW